MDPPDQQDPADDPPAREEPPPRPKHVRQTPQWYGNPQAHLAVADIFPTYKAAINLSDSTAWKLDMQAEIDSFISHKVFTFVPTPTNCKIISCR